MKAAVLHKFGDAPRYEDHSDPIADNDHVLMTVKAASIKNLDKLRASGTHYASYTHLPAIVGIDAVGVLEDGTRVYGHTHGGAIAEKALIHKAAYTTLPDGIDDITAAALPNAVIGAAMAIRNRAAIKQGDVVLINGATGVTGQLAVQIAKHYGAAKILVTGRNGEILEQLKDMGADETISLKQEEDAIIKQLKQAHASQPINIVIDYLWGRPIELIIAALKGGGINNYTTRVKIVTVGSMAGEHIDVASGTLRSSAIELLGSGIGSLSQEDMKQYRTEILPEMFALAAAGKLKIQTETTQLKNVADVWHKEITPGKRLVITM